MADFNELFDKFSKKYVARCKSRGGVEITRDGVKVKAESLGSFLDGADWEGSVEDFLAALEARLKAGTGEVQHRGLPQKMALDHPDIARRTRYTEADRQLLRHIRLASVRDGRLLLAYTGNGEVETYKGIPADDSDLACELRRIWAGVPSSGHGESRLEELTGLLERACANLTADVRDQAPALGVASRVVASSCPTSLIRGDMLQFWARAEGDIKVGDGFTLKGDFADLVKANIEYLWGEPSLYIDPPAILTNDRHTPALHYIDLDQVAGACGPTDAWDSFMRKMSPDEGEAFKAFIWSIFDASNHHRQLLYLLDDGYSGKSAVINAICHSLGTELCAALNKDSLSNQFWGWKVWDKRLVTIGDNKNRNLVRSQAMHSILGCDLNDIEKKGCSSFTYQTDCKVIAAGNIPLEIDASARHEVTRVLPLKICYSTEQMVKDGVIKGENGKATLDKLGNPIFLGDNAWPKALKEQFWNFLATCKEPYKSLCPNRCAIILPDSSLDTIAGQFDTDSADLMDELTRALLDITNDPTDFVSNADLYGAYTEYARDLHVTAEYGDFKDYLLHRHHLEMRQQGRAYGRKRGLVGARLKTGAGSVGEGGAPDLF